MTRFSGWSIYIWKPASTTFDTARVYISGQSETAIRDCIVKRYPRESFVLTDKLSTHLFHKEEEIRPLFEKQLVSCGWSILIFT